MAGIEPATFGLLVHYALPTELQLGQVGLSELLRYQYVWTSKPKVVGSIPNMVRHIFQIAQCGYKHSE